MITTNVYENVCNYGKQNIRSPNFFLSPELKLLDFVGHG